MTGFLTVFFGPNASPDEDVILSEAKNLCSLLEAAQRSTASDRPGSRR